MIHLISDKNSSLYYHEIEGLHRARAEVFIGELGWKLQAQDGLERDEYDDGRACNMVGFSHRHEVTMGLRFRPTDDCSMLVDHFSHALASGTPTINDKHTWELSRGFCRERGVRRHNLRRKAACMIAPLELAYQAGITRCVGFTDVRMLSFCYGVGWKLNLLGSPVQYGEGEAIAYEIPVNHSALTDMRNMWGLPSPAWLEITALADGEHSVHSAADRLTRERPELEKISASSDVDVGDGARSITHKAERYYSTF